MGAEHGRASAVRMRKRRPGSPPGVGACASTQTDPARLYAYGGQVFRSDDGGTSWANVTSFGRRSIIGGEVADLAVSPLDAEDVVAVNGAGVWRSLDGGVSWAGLNDSLPNLPGRRILPLPRGAAGVRLLAGKSGVIEWVPGEKQVWRTAEDPASARDKPERRFSRRAQRRDYCALGRGRFPLCRRVRRPALGFDRQGPHLEPAAQPRAWPSKPFSGRANEPRLALAALARNGRAARPVRACSAPSTAASFGTT